MLTQIDNGCASDRRKDGTFGNPRTIHRLQGSVDTMLLLSHLLLLLFFKAINPRK